MSGPKVNETPEEAMSSHFEYKNKDQHTHTHTSIIFTPSLNILVRIRPKQITEQSYHD